METLKTCLEWIIQEVLAAHPTSLIKTSRAYWQVLIRFLDLQKYKLDQFPDLPLMLEQLQEVITYTKENSSPQNSDLSWLELLDILQGPLDVTLATCFNAKHKQKLKNFVVMFEMMHSETTEEDFLSLLETELTSTSSTSVPSPVDGAVARSSKKRKAEQSLEDLLISIDGNTQNTSPKKIYPAFSSISLKKEGDQKTYTQYADEWKKYQAKISIYPADKIKWMPDGKNSNRWKESIISLTWNYSPLTKLDIQMNKLIELVVKEQSSKERVERQNYKKE
uniref:Uncharacterized protein n=1 Tax=Parvoviridae sp. TaxID=1940570 RepID=A0A893A2Z1_9VIRU|nr:MAG: hypothetical protein 1 [Parvoviridae sp.]